MKRAFIIMPAVAVALIAVFGPVTRAESVPGLVEEGNQLFRERKLNEALEKYRRAQTLDPASPAVHYNIGNVLYQLGQFDKAYEEYRQSFTARERALAEGARFNAGNSHLARGNWQDAIRNYQEALRLEPSDRDAKKNLELALREMEEERRKQPKQPPPQGQQGPPPPEGQKSPQNQDQQPRDQKDQGKTGQSSDRQREQKQEGPKQKEKLTKEEAMRLLGAMKGQDKGPKNPIATPPPERKPERDW